MIQTGPVTLGKDVFVGEVTVLDIDTSMGDGAQLGHASSLHAGQAVPAGEHWHGSPAQPHRRWTTGRWSPPPAAPCAGPATPRCSCSTCWRSTCRWRSAAWTCCSTRSRSSPRCWTPRPLAVTSRGVLPRCPGHLARAVLRPLLARPVLHAHRPAVAQPGSSSRTRSTPCTASTTRSPHDRAHDQPQVLHRSSSVTAPTSSTTCAGWGTTSTTVRADRVELRPDGQARQPLPELGRQRNGGRRRAVDHQRRLLQHLLPGVPGVDRGAQLPREPHRLPLTGQDGRQLPARRRRSWSPSTGRSGRTWGCWARPASRSRERSSGTASSTDLATRGGAAPPPRRQEQAQPRHHGPVPAGRGGSSSSWSPCSAWPPRTSTPPSGAAVVALANVRILLFSVALLRPGRTCLHGVPASEAAVLLDLRRRLLAARALLEAGCRRLSPGLQRHAVQERDLADAGCPARQAGLRRRLQSGGEEPGDHRRRRHAQRGERGSSATRRRTAPSSPTASRSVPAAPSGSAPSSTTA